MLNKSIVALFLFSVLSLCSCHSASVATFGSEYYPPTERVEIFTDVANVPRPYLEIGYVEAKGGLTVSKQQLLNDMIEQARTYGANALIKISFFDEQYYTREIGTYDKPRARAVMIRYKDQARLTDSAAAITGYVRYDPPRRAYLYFSNENVIDIMVTAEDTSYYFGYETGDLNKIADRYPKSHIRRMRWIR